MIRLPAVLLALALAAFSTEVAAHAALVSSEPRDGAVVETVPEHLVLTFNEPVTPLVLRLVGPGGTVLTPANEVHGNRLVVMLPQNLARGTQALSWRVTSQDGHPIAGSVVFSIGGPGGEAGTDTAATAPGLAPAIWLGRVLIYLGLFVGVGGVFFGAWLSPQGRAKTRPSSLLRSTQSLDCRDEPGNEEESKHAPAALAGLRTARRIILACLVLGLLAAPLSLGLQGLDALGLGFSGLADPDAWRAGWATAYGSTALLAFLAMASALGSMSLAGSPARVSAVLALLVAGLALSASGHAGAASPQWLTRPAVFVHAVGVAFWVGALVPLAAMLATRPAGTRAALTRFSAIIPFALAALALAGIALAIVQLETPGALLVTDYGRILAAKLVLVVALLALAARNRFRLTAPAEQGDAVAAQKMRRAILAEILLGAAILGLVALWRSTPPPRAEAAAAALRAAVSLHLHDAGTMADVVVAPGRAGPVVIEIDAYDSQLRPLAPKEVTVVLANPAAGIEPIRRVATPGGSGPWTAAATLPVPGEWRLRLDLLVTDFQKVTLEGAVQIK